MLIEATGDFKNIMVADKEKQSFPINSVISFQMGGSTSEQSQGGKQLAKSGFVVAGDSGQIRVFFKSDLDNRVPYKRTEGNDLQMSGASDQDSKDRMLINDVMYHKITNMALNPKQDTLLFTTDANQILKV